MKKLFLTFFILNTFFLFSQKDEFKLYNYSNGLPNNYIYDLEQDSLGYLWLGTGDGLIRMDESNYINYSTNQNKTGGQNVINTVLLHKNSIWYSDKKGSIYELHEHQTEKIKTPFTHKILNSHSISKNQLLFVSKNEGLFIYNTKIKNGALLETKGIAINHSLFHNNNLWLCTIKGIKHYKYKNNTFNYISTHYDSLDVTSIDIHEASKKIFISTKTNGIYVTTQTLKDTLTKFENSLNNVKNIFVDVEDNLWISDFGNGIKLYKYDSTGFDLFKSYTEDSGLPSDYITDIKQDYEGNIWLGTYGKGLSLKPNDYLKHLANLNSKSSQVTSVVIFQEQTYFSSGQHILKIKNDNYIDTIYTLDVKDKITCFEFLNTKELFIGCENYGLYKHNIETNESQHLLNQVNNIANKINDIQKQYNTLWIATYGGLFNIDSNGNILNTYTTENGLRHNLINVVKITNDQTVVVGTKNNRVFFIKNNQVTELKLPSKSQNINLTTIEISPNNEIFIGTSNSGIYRIKGKEIKQYTQDNGLKSNYVFGLDFVNNDNILVYSENLLSMLNLKKETSVTLDAIHQKSYSIHSNSKSNTGKIFIGTKKGVLSFDTEKYLTNFFEPKLGFTKLTINDSIYDISEAQKNIILPYGRHKVLLDFKGVNFTNNDELYYSYMLEGYEDNNTWHDSKDATALYKQLSSGKYRFHIKVCKQGVCKTQKMNLRIEIKPPFWQSYWFIFLLFMIFFWSIIILFIVIGKKNKESKASFEKDLKIKNQELRLKNNDLIKNLEFTKLIQKATIPKVPVFNNDTVFNVFSSQISSHKVYSDFVWFEKTDSHLIFVLADPNRTGISGSLISVWCMNILKTAVKEHRTYNPETLLNYLDLTIDTDLNTNETQNSFNMTIGAINFESMELTLSSANQDAYFVTKEDEIKLFKGERRSIGNHFKGNSFSNTVFDIKNYKSFYFVTDGLNPQIDNIENFQSDILQQLSDLLLNLSEKSAFEQDEKIKEFLNRNKSQSLTDDFTILGFKMRG